MEPGSSLSNRDRACARLYLLARRIDRHRRRTDGAKTEICFPNSLWNLLSHEIRLFALIIDGFPDGRFFTWKLILLKLHLYKTQRNMEVRLILILLFHQSLNR